MHISADHPLYRTHALRRPDTMLAAINHLRGATGRAEVEGLVELLLDPPSARAATTVLEALHAGTLPVVTNALLAALDSPHITVRLIALQALHEPTGYT